MRVYKVFIRPDPDGPDIRQGWARAATEGCALALADHRDALALPSRCIWLGA